MSELTTVARPYAHPPIRFDLGVFSFLRALLLAHHGAKRSKTVRAIQNRLPIVALNSTFFLNPKL